MLKHDFKFQPSVIYQTLLGIVIFLCIICVLMVSVHFLLRLILILILLGYGWVLYQRHGLLRHRRAVLSIARVDDDSWVIKTQEGEFEVGLDGQSTVTSLVSVLCFRSKGGRATPHPALARHLLPQGEKDNAFFSCVVFPDSLRHDEYRKLLVLLRMY